MDASRQAFQVISVLVDATVANVPPKIYSNTRSKRTRFAPKRSFLARLFMASHKQSKRLSNHKKAKLERGVEWKRIFILKKSKRRFSFGVFFLRTCLIIGIWGLCFLGLAVLWFSYDLPDVNRLKAPSRNPGITIMTQDGTVIGTYGDLYEDVVDVSQLPPYVPQALLAIEDHRFYSHFGVDVIGLVRAAYTNLQADRIVQGGSTITQQLAKNFLQSQGLYQVHDRSIRRKIQEVLMAVWLEWNFTKEQILTMYVNRVYFGAGAYGIDAAARKYFNKSARQLTLYEAAVIAGLLKAPSRYSPAHHPHRAQERARVVLSQMVEAGFIKSAEVYLPENFSKEGLQTVESGQGVKFFTDWVYESIPNYISIGAKDLVVVVSLDLSIQRKAEQALIQTLDKYGKEYKVNQGAIVAMKPDGAIKAMVGGKDYNSSQFNRAIAQRQAGSAFKLFIYLAALEAGLSPDSQVEDTPISIGKWRPGNYKWQSRGTLTVEEAFAFSVNAASIRLAQYAGVQKIDAVARRLGITSDMPNNLTIALGTADVSLVDLTAAYATFANRGMAVWPYAILEIRDKEGNILYQHQEAQGNTIVPAQQLTQMYQLLKAVTVYGTGKSANVLGSPVYGKTGSNQNRDAWFIAFTADYAVGVWFGNDDNAPMIPKSTGGRLPTITWAALMKAVYENSVPSSMTMGAVPEDASVILEEENAYEDYLNAQQHRHLAPKSQENTFLHPLTSSSHSQGAAPVPTPGPEPSISRREETERHGLNDLIAEIAQQ